MSRKSKVMLTLSILLTAGFLTTSIVSYFVARDSLSEQIAESALPLTSDNIYSEIQQDLLQPIFISSLMAQDTFVRDWTIGGEKDVNKIIRYLKEIQDRYQTVTSFFVSEKTRRYYHSSGVLKSVSETDPQDSWYFRVRSMPDDYEINIDRDSADLTKMTVFVNHRVFDYAGKYIGTIGVGLGVKTVKDLIENYQQRYGRTIFFVDRQGAITLTGSTYTGPDNLRQIEGISPFTTQILTSPGVSLVFESGSRTTFFNSRLVPDFDWYLIVLQQDVPGQNRIQKTLLGNLILSLGITALVLVLASLTISGYQKKLESMATTDKLTGIANRQIFDPLFSQMRKSSLRRKVPLSMIIFDIDHFKQVNDNYGHPAGDQVLRGVVSCIRRLIRESDVLFRWGGEEFLLLLSDCTLAQAEEMAERIRKTIENLIHSHAEATIQVTISLGVAEGLEDESSSDLINRADEALYRAKENGRNRVELAS